MSKTADAIVIGAGSTGCSIAFHLARSGLKVLLADRGAIASGPTGRSVAIVRQHYVHSSVSLLARISLPFFQHWRDEVGGDCNFIRTGFMTGVAEHDADALRENVEEQRKLGIAMELVSVRQMQELQPDTIPTGLGGGVYEPDGGYCDPRAASIALADGVERHGGTVLQGCAVHNIRVAAGSVQGVDTSQGPVDAPVVVNAAGPWAARLAEAMGSPLPIKATRHCLVLMTVTGSESLPDLMAYGEHANRFYLCPGMAGEYAVGSLDPADSKLVDPEDCDDEVHDDDIANHAARAAGRFRRLQGAQMRKGWAAMFDETPDDNPLVGPDPHIRGSFVAAGLSGHGFKLCPVIGRGIADMVTKGGTDLPLGIFAVDRFAKGQALKAKRPYLGGKLDLSRS